MTALPHQLDRTITIGARRETVFSFFTDEARWASWWGTGSAIDARPGGRMLIKYPNGVEVSGEVLDVRPPERLVFTYGYANNPRLGPGASRVTIQLADVAEGTRLSLTHEFAEAADRDHHVQGWRYQLAVFANVVGALGAGRIAEQVDAWFAAWSEADSSARREKLAAIARPDVRFRDRFSHVDGLDDLVPHIGAALQFMPGLTIARTGDLLSCQDITIAHWTAVSAKGETTGRGENVFQLDADGRIARVTGLWR
jgi:uncharacterized protein YndB with AHSA1/START domain